MSPQINQYQVFIARMPSLPVAQPTVSKTVYYLFKFSLPYALLTERRDKYSVNQLLVAPFVCSSSLSHSNWVVNNGRCSSIKVTVKVHTLDISPLRSESPPQKRSGMARVLKGFHSFTCTPTRSSAIGSSHTCLRLPSRSWYSFTDPGRMEGWVDLGAK